MSIASSLLVVIAIGAVVGWLASLVVKGTSPGLFGDVIMGIAGAFVAGFLLPCLGINTSGTVVSGIFASVAGAAGLLLLVRLLRRARRA
jgi:uncharacterized membrane protein YeaQ/YmgE (transglycosylase-associated protein family)